MEAETMKTVKLIANRPHYYERDLEAEEHYEARQDHAEVLMRVGAARLEQPSKREYRRRDMVAEK